MFNITSCAVAMMMLCSPAVANKAMIPKAQAAATLKPCSSAKINTKQDASLDCARTAPAQDMKLKPKN
jgi:hypothetical protein